MKTKWSICVLLLWLPVVCAAQNDTIMPVVKLDGAVVTAHNEFIKPVECGYKLNIVGNIDTKGIKTTDILRRLPMIIIKDKSISMAGKEAVEVYVDNRQIRLPADQISGWLNSFPPENIKEITVISSPTAKYTAEGNIGIIKITTKTTPNQGWKGSLSAEYGLNSYSSYSGTAFASYTSSKLFFDGSIYYDNISSKNTMKYKSLYPDGEIVGYNPKKWNNHSALASLSLGYNFSSRTTLIADLKIPVKNTTTITDIDNYAQYINSSSLAVDSTIFSKGSSVSDANTFSTGLYFSHKISNEADLSVSADYLTNKAASDREFVSQTQTGQEISPGIRYRSTSDATYDIATAKLDFEFPLFTCRASAGAKAAFISTKAENSFSGGLNTDNIFRYDENIQSVYFDLRKKAGKWSFYGGLRGEFTQTSGDSETMSQKNDSAYFNIFPSASVAYAFDKSHRISLQYSDRIQRPKYNYLDPFKYYISKYSYSVGNPYLRPSRIRNLELIYTYGDSFQAKLYYTVQRDRVGKLVILDPNDYCTEIEMANNYLNTDVSGLTLYKSLKPARWYSATLSGNVEYQSYTSKSTLFDPIRGFKGMISAYNDFYVGDNLRFMINLTEIIPGLYNYRVRKNYFQADCAVVYSFKTIGIDLKAELSDLFNTANPEYTYISNGVKQIYNNHYDTRAFKISATWKFGNWKNRNMKKSTSNTEERSRL